ncbi:hypothetical protein [Halomonas sp. LBP4]|uniref:hypothetical protein n=1 Tax=Halomonas sp. LBP4 TaxID=2044917 RepID=UPI0011B4C2A5|nr:hypothetical protein [Halomonas sp. LBP4]
MTDDYVLAYRHQRGLEPSFSESKGDLCEDGRGGYLLEEFEEMTEAFHQGVSGAAPHSISVGAH